MLRYLELELRKLAATLRKLTAKLWKVAAFERRSYQAARRQHVRCTRVWERICRTEKQHGPTAGNRRYHAIYHIPCRDRGHYYRYVYHYNDITITTVTMMWFRRGGNFRISTVRGPLYRKEGSVTRLRCSSQLRLYGAGRAVSACRRCLRGDVCTEMCAQFRDWPLPSGLA